MTDIVQRIVDAATQAIRNERPALESPEGRVRGVTIELMLTSAGLVDDAACYVERRTTGAALLAKKEPAA